MKRGINGKSKSFKIPSKLKETNVAELKSQLHVENRKKCHKT